MLEPPTRKERELVWRCLVVQEVLIGSEDDIWNGAPGTAMKTLATVRLCLDAIRELVAEKQAIGAAMIKSLVLQTDGLTALPAYLDEVSEFLVTDAGARAYWDSLINDTRFPVTCPICKRSAAFVGMNSVECKARCCPATERF